MLTIKLLLLFIPAAFVAVAAWQSVEVLKRAGPEPDDDGSRGWLDVISGVLLVMPVVVVVLLAFVIFLVIQDAYLIRTAHTFFLVGLWLSFALSILAIPTSVREGAPSILSMLNVVITVLAAVYFTPISHFVDALPPVSAIAPLIAGVGLIAVAYAALFRLRKALPSPPEGSRQKDRVPGAGAPRTLPPGAGTSRTLPPDTASR